MDKIEILLIYKDDSSSDDIFGERRKFNYHNCIVIKYIKNVFEKDDSFTFHRRKK